MTSSLTSSVPNLGHVKHFLARHFTYWPSSKGNEQWEVGVLKMCYDVIMTSSVPNLGHVKQFWRGTLPTDQVSKERTMGSRCFNNVLWRHHDVISTKLGHVIQFLARHFTYWPSFKGNEQWEVGVLKMCYDVIMTSSVPNLGHVKQFLARHFTYWPSFKGNEQWEVGVLKMCYDVIMTSSVPNLGHVKQFLARHFTYWPSFKENEQWEVGVLKMCYDVIMTSSVPNLGHVKQFLARHFTYWPSFKENERWEVGVLKICCDVTSIKSLKMRGHYGFQRKPPFWKRGVGHNGHVKQFLGVTKF